MARGRCAGCGLEDASARKVEKHVAQCSDFIELYRSNPAAALSPVEEMERRTAEVNSDEFVEAKEQARDELYAGYRRNNERRVEHQANRWKSRQFVSGSGTSTPALTPSNGRLPIGDAESGHPSDPGRRVALRQAEIRVG